MFEWIDMLLGHVISWPSAIVVAVLVFRRQVGSLFRRQGLRRVSLGRDGVELVYDEQQKPPQRFDKPTDVAEPTD